MQSDEAEFTREFYVILKAQSVGQMRYFDFFRAVLSRV